MVIAVIREDLIDEDVLPGTPTMLRYQVHANNGSMYNTPPAYGIYICGLVFQWLLEQGGLEAMGQRNREKAAVLYDFFNGSMYNTPPAYGIYICGLVFQWLLEQGGLEAMGQRNREKAAVLYDFLDSSRLFRGTVEKKDRSLMNVPFITGSDELDAQFVAEAAQAGLVNLKGHRTVGGMRASIPPVPGHGGEKGPLFDERALHHRQRRAGCTIRGGGRPGRLGQFEGPPHCGRYAGQHLQRHAPSGRGKAGAVHGPL